MHPSARREEARPARSLRIFSARRSRLIWCVTYSTRALGVLATRRCASRKRSTFSSVNMRRSRGTRSKARPAVEHRRAKEQQAARRSWWAKTGRSLHKWAAAGSHAAHGFLAARRLRENAHRHARPVAQERLGSSRSIARWPHLGHRPPSSSGRSSAPPPHRQGAALWDVGGDGHVAEAVALDPLPYEPESSARASSITGRNLSRAEDDDDGAERVAERSAAAWRPWSRTRHCSPSRTATTLASPGPAARLHSNQYSASSDRPGVRVGPARRRGRGRMRLHGEEAELSVDLIEHAMPPPPAPHAAS